MCKGDLQAPANAFPTIAPGHGVLLAEWDESDQTGYVRAFGIVTSVNRNHGTASIEWRAADTVLKPNPQGRRYWRNGFFEFRGETPKRYMLDDLFAEAFPEREHIVLERTIGSVRRAADVPEENRPGYVYLIESKEGFKIGRTTRMKERTQLFAVKLPFPIKIRHYAWFSDCVKTESLLHRHFAAQRLEGEWFALSENDIDYIKQLGEWRPV